jgi:hypothetical protein
MMSPSAADARLVRDLRAEVERLRKAEREAFADGARAAFALVRHHGYMGSDAEREYVSGIPEMWAAR